MASRKLPVIVAGIACITALLAGSARSGHVEVQAVNSNAAQGKRPVAADDVKISILFDNRTSGAAFKPSWGFSCLVEGVCETILFDTGGDGDILIGNMDSLGIDPATVDRVVISHNHWDHTGGLKAFLELGGTVDVIVPASFPDAFKRGLRDAGSGVVEVDEPLLICDGVYSTGELGESIREQSLVIQTDRGLIIITGCAHPGIVAIVTRARELLGADVLCVLGGFHLVRTGRKALETIIDRFVELGVEYAGPCHCSGEEAIELFRERYGDRFIDIGAGTVLSVRDLR